MKFVCFFIFLLLSIYCFSQSGTLIIATISENGVVIAADSRSSFYENDSLSHKPFAYCDSNQKIFKLKQFAIGIGGVAVIGKDFYSTIIDAFNQTTFYDVSLQSTINAFVAYLNKNYPLISFPERKSNYFIGGGYVNSKPQIIAIDSSREILQHSGTIISDTAAMKYARIEFSKPISLNKSLENIIYDYATGENKLYQVGGAVSIVLVKPDNQILNVQNDFSNRNYKSLFDFYRQVEDGKIKMVYLIENGKEKLLNQK